MKFINEVIWIFINKIKRCLFRRFGLLEIVHYQIRRFWFLETINKNWVSNTFFLNVFLNGKNRKVVLHMTMIAYLWFWSTSLVDQFRFSTLQLKYGKSSTTFPLKSDRWYIMCSLICNIIWFLFQELELFEYIDYILLFIFVSRIILTEWICWYIYIYIYRWIQVTSDVTL